MDNAVKVLEIVKDEVASLSKKEWAPPSFEIFAKDVVRSGNHDTGPEAGGTYNAFS